MEERGGRYPAGMIRMILPCALLLLALLPGCAVSRQDQLRARADRIEDTLQNEQKYALELPPQERARAQKLDHLTSLRAVAPRPLEW